MTLCFKPFISVFHNISCTCARAHPLCSRMTGTGKQVERINQYLASIDLLQIRLKHTLKLVTTHHLVWVDDAFCPTTEWQSDPDTRRRSCGLRVWSDCCDSCAPLCCVGDLESHGTGRMRIRQMTIRQSQSQIIQYFLNMNFNLGKWTQWHMDF